MGFDVILRRLFSGAILKTLSLCCAVGASLLLMPFLIHSLGDRNYSLWVLIGTFAGYYGLVDFGLSAATGRYVSRALGQNDLHEINVIANTSLFIYMCLGSIVIVLSTAVALTMPLFIQNPTEAVILTKALILMGLVVGLQFPVRVAGGILYSYVRHDLIAYAGFIELFLKLSLTYYFISKGYGLLSLAAVTLAVGIVEYILEFVFMKHIFPSFHLNRKHIDPSRIRDLFRYSVIAMIGNTSKMMRMKVVPFMVVGVAGVNIVVMFSVAQRLLEYFQQLIGNITGMFITVFSQLEGQNNVAVINKGFKYTTIITILLSLYVGVSLIVYGQQFINVWLGDRYTNVFYLLAILIVPIMVSLILSPCTQVLFGISQHSYCAIIFTVELILVVVCGFGFGWMYGMYGIAFGVSLGILIPELCLPFVMCKVLKTRFNELYGDMIIPFFLRATLVMSCVLLVRDYVAPSYLSLLLWNIGQFIIVCPLLFLLLPKELRVLATTLLLKRSEVMV